MSRHGIHHIVPSLVQPPIKLRRSKDTRRARKAGSTMQARPAEEATEAGPHEAMPTLLAEAGALPVQTAPHGGADEAEASGTTGPGLRDRLRACAVSGEGLQVLLHE